MNPVSAAVGIALIAAFLAGCQQQKYMAGGAVFDTKEEALAFTRNATGATVKEIAPLPAPVADSITVVSPTRDQAVRVLSAANPGLSPDMLSYLADAALINWSLPGAQIEQRRSFRRVVAKQADAPSLADIAPGGYLLWLEAPTRDQYFMHVAAKGDSTTSRLVVPDVSGGSPAAHVTAMMEALEKFVREHPAKR